MTKGFFPSLDEMLGLRSMTMCEMADFSTRTFLERVSLAAREPVYSAAFAWVLDDRSPLSLPERLAILEQISGTDLAGAKSINATTE